MHFNRSKAAFQRNAGVTTGEQFESRHGLVDGEKVCNPVLALLLLCPTSPAFCYNVVDMSSCRSWSWLESWDNFWLPLVCCGWQSEYRFPFTVETIRSSSQEVNLASESCSNHGYSREGRKYQTNLRRLPVQLYLQRFLQDLDCRINCNNFWILSKKLSSLEKNLVH